MPLGPFERSAADLAPGDLRSLESDWSGFTVEAVRSARHPLFEEAYDRLRREFEPRGEMERREVIVDRLAWDPRSRVRGLGLRYELIVIRRGAEIAAVRDHTVILGAASTSRAVVHLSHALVEPGFRGTGLAAWLRALPLNSARESGVRSGVGPPAAVTLVAEMEHGPEQLPEMKFRLRSYGKAGFRMVDPNRARYFQPDFRAAAEIDRTSVQPLSLALVLRRVGLEHENEISGVELRELVAALHGMFAVHVRDDHMAPLRKLAQDFTLPHEAVSLIAPWREAEAGEEERSR
jgi:GNAT superfamily N-acetyltransferase